MVYPFVTDEHLVVNVRVLRVPQCHPISKGSLEGRSRRTQRPDPTAAWAGSVPPLSEAMQHGAPLPRAHRLSRHRHRHRPPATVWLLHEKGQKAETAAGPC